MQVTTTPKQVLNILLCVSICLVILHLVSQAFLLHFNVSPLATELVQRFNMDVEQSIPTWLNTFLLLAVGLIACFIGVHEKGKKANHATEWMFLGAFFVYLSIDEATSLHELAIEPVQNLLSISSGVFFFAWILPAGVILLLLGASLYRWFKHLPKNVRNLFILAVFLFLTGAIGVEMISGAYWSASGFVNDFTYRSLNAAEEGLELFGTSFALYAFLSFATIKKIQLRLKQS